MFYVYEYYNLITQEVFYVGKGTGKRYRQMTGRNEDFIKYVRENECDVRIIKYFENEDDVDFRLDWMYIEKDWEYDELLEEICNSPEVKKKWTPALIRTHKVNK